MKNKFAKLGGVSRVIGAMALRDLGNLLAMALSKWEKMMARAYKRFMHKSWHMTVMNPCFERTK
jgi:hypothetical protein